MRNLSYSKILIVLLLVTMSCTGDFEIFIPVRSVQLNKTSLTMMVGQNDSLQVTINPDNATKKEVKWHSSDESVVQVNSVGVLTAVAVGKANIVVTSVSGERTDSCEVEVLAGAEGITLEPAIVKMSIGTSQTLLASLFRDDGGDSTIVWKSTNEEFVKVDSKGVITGVAEGVAEVEASSADGKYSATCHVTVIDIRIEYATIPAGQFMMGSPSTEPNRDGDEVQHSVVLSKEYQISKYEITNTQYCKFLNLNAIGANGKWEAAHIDASQTLIYPHNWGVKYDDAQKKWVAVAGKENFPVVSVTWYGAAEFALWVGGDLPTEAQWEYACRGDYPNKPNATNTLPFGVGTGRTMNASLANIYASYAYDLTLGEKEDLAAHSSNTTQKVGTYAANNYGLHDMHGNVWEWCKDGYDQQYGGNGVVQLMKDPVGLESASEKVLKGGSWYFFARCCRAAFRHKALPGVYGAEIGFRVVHL